MILWLWMDLDFSFLFYESGSPQLFRGKNNIQDENENMVWRIESFVYLWNIRILFGFRFQHTNKEIFVLFSTFRLWTRSINIYLSHFTGFFGSCWNIFLELNWYGLIYGCCIFVWLAAEDKREGVGVCLHRRHSPWVYPSSPSPRLFFVDTSQYR